MTASVEICSNRVMLLEPFPVNLMNWAWWSVYELDFGANWRCRKHWQSIDCAIYQCIGFACCQDLWVEGQSNTNQFISFCLERKVLGLLT